MSKINERSTIAEVGAIVCEALKQEGLDAFLSGGAVVSISRNAVMGMVSHTERGSEDKYLCLTKGVFVDFLYYKSRIVEVLSRL
jgi:chaperonin GroEL (HSP60 family)